MPRWIDVVRLRVRSVVRRERLDAELDRELRAHLERQIEENVGNGMSPADARRAALSTFGGVESVREEARDARGVAVIENLGRDLRYTLRGLLHDRMLLVAATLSIALGAGGNIAVFTLAREFVLAAPDVRDPNRLVTIEVSHGSHASYQRWLDLDASGALEHIAGYSIEREINWLDGDAAVSIVPMLVTSNFFDVTGVPVALGRGFSAAEAAVARDPHIVVISHELWQRKLGGDSSLIGGRRTLTLNGAPYTIIGILPPRLRSVVGFGIAPAVYLPLNRALVPDLETRSAAIVKLLGRLEPGQRVGEGRAALDAVDRRLARLDGDTLYGGVQEFAPVGALAANKPLRTVGAFMALLGTVSLLVLVIACANVAGLLIARGIRRRQEIAIRLAIGGSRARLLQQLLVEGLWLALIGTAAGLALSVAFMRVVNQVSLPIPIPVQLHLGPDGAVLLCALGIVILTLLLAALFPAVHATRLSLIPALKREETFAVMRRLTARGVLLTGQVAVSTVLLVTALLFVRNLTRSRVTDPGFEAHDALMAQVGFVQGQPDADHRAFLERAVERVRALPGVRDASYASSVPLTVHGGSTEGRSARIGGKATAEHIEYALSSVGPGYFATLDIPLLGGREFQRTDGSGAAQVAIVNDEFSRRYFGGASPIGQRVQFSDPPLDLEIVGVVANVKHITIGERQRAAIYRPLREDATDLRVAFVFARTQGDPASLVTPTRQTLGELDRSVSIVVEPMESVLRFALLPSRIGAAVLGVLGVLGLVLAAFGLYAIVSFNVSRRTGEIAVRSALGATRGDILRLVVRDASLHVGTGIVIGLGLSALITAPLAAFLMEGLSTRDPMSFAGTALLFVLVTVLASWLPARRATQVSPAVAMRVD